jgi:hypothetical protein
MRIFNRVSLQAISASGLQQFSYLPINVQFLDPQKPHSVFVATCKTRTCENCNETHAGDLRDHDEDPIETEF